MRARHRLLLLALPALLFAGQVPAQLLPGQPAPNGAETRSATADRVFAEAKPRLLQIRSLVTASRSQSSIGSGFLVRNDGKHTLAVTNYHVVSQKVLEPGQYTLEWVSTDNTRGELEVLAIDIAHDLALVRFKSATAALGTPFALATREPQRGEKVFSLGRPLDLGFNIVEGTHNGVVEGDYREQFLFSGPINSGMSGGPALTGSGEVYGINVARNLRGQLVSYVVPVRFAAELIRNTPADAPAPDGAALVKAITQQLATRQKGLHAQLFNKPLAQRELGRFQVAEEILPYVRCWASTSNHQEQKSFSTDSLNCRSDASLFLGNNLNIGDVAWDHTLVRSREFNRLRFDALLASQFGIPGPRMPRKHAGVRRCTEDFVTLGERDWRVSFCASALRKFQGIYLFNMVAMSVDGREPDKQGERQALVTRLAVSGASYDDAQAIVRRFLEATR